MCLVGVIVGSLVKCESGFCRARRVSGSQNELVEEEGGLGMFGRNGPVFAVDLS